jgi:hypothetical protein
MNGPSTNNIVSFPAQANPRQVPKDFEEIRLQKCLNHISEAVAEMSEIITVSLTELGFELQEQQDLYPDIAFAIEAVKSIMFKYYGLSFYTQTIAENIYVEQAPGEFHRVAEPILKDGNITFQPVANSVQNS